MTIAVRGYYEVSDWMSSAKSNPVTGVAWSTDDVVVVAAWVSDSGSTLTVPTNANLTFTQRAVTTSSGEAPCHIYTAKAASTQSSQTIASGYSGGNNDGGTGVWVFSGADDFATGGMLDSEVESEIPISLTVSAGSAVVDIVTDWNTTAGPWTGETGSGSLTEREDTQDTNGGVWAADWVDTSSGTFDFGVDDYTGMHSTACAVEITATSASGATATPASVAATTTVTTVTPSAGSTIAAAAVPAPAAVSATSMVTYTGWSPPAADTTDGGGTNATVTPDPVLTTTSITTVTPSSGATIAPAPILAVTTVTTITPSTGSTIAASPVLAVGAVGAVTMIGGSTIAAATVAGLVSLPPPTLSAGTTITAAAIPAPATVPTPTVSAGSTVNVNITPATISATATITTVTPSSGSTIAASPVAATASITTVTPSAGSTIVASPVAATTLITTVAPSTTPWPASVSQVGTSGSLSAPGASGTGWTKTGVVLSTTASGARFDDLDLTDLQIQVNHDDAQITNCFLANNDFYLIQVFSGDDCLITNCHFDNQFTNITIDNAATGAIIDGCLFERFENGLRPGVGTILRNSVMRRAYGPAEPHYDGVEAFGGEDDVTVYNCVIFLTTPADAWLPDTGCVNLDTTIDNFVMYDCLLGGGSSTLNFGATGGETITDLRIGKTRAGVSAPVYIVRDSYSSTHLRDDDGVYCIGWDVRVAEDDGSDWSTFDNTLTTDTLGGPNNLSDPVTTITPSPILATTTVTTVTPSAGSTIAASSIPAPTTIPVPTVTAGSTVNATVTPDPILVTTSITTVTPSAGSTIAAASVDRSVS